MQIKEVGSRLIKEVIREYHKEDSWDEPGLMSEETYIQLYLNGNLPTSEEEWLEMRGITRFSFMLTQISAILVHETPSEILRKKKMAEEMIRLMQENEEKGFFFAVGVGRIIHKCPENPNILQRLESGGFRIERVAPEEILRAPETGEKSYSPRLLF